MPVMGAHLQDRSRVDLPNLATRCQYIGVHLPDRSNVDLPNLATRCQYRGLHLPANLGQICQIWPLDASTGWVHLLVDLGQICQIQPLDVSTGGSICWQIQGRSAKFRPLGVSTGGIHLLADLGQICQIQPLGVSTGGTSASRSRVDLPNLGYQMSGTGWYICWQIQSRSAKFRPLDVSTGGYICWQIQGRSAKFSPQLSVLGVHLLADLGKICQIQPLGVSTGGKHLLADLGQICQIQALDVSSRGVHLPADVGQFCQIWPPDTSTGGTSARQIQGRSAKFRSLDVSRGGTSAGRFRVDLQNLATRCQYWGYICQQIKGRYAKFIHQVSVMGVHRPADQGQICQIQLLGVSTGGTSAGKSRVDLPMCTPTSILHVNLGKYDLSELKSFIIIQGAVLDGVLGCQEDVTSDMTLQCYLTVQLPNYSEIKENSYLFLKNPKWLANTSHNIYPMMHL